MTTVFSNPWLSRRVLAYAHQGGAKEAPSSTLFAIERALRLGVPAIELDVHASRDGVIVVNHDPTLEATANGSGPIVAKDLAELCLLDNAYYFCPDHPPQSRCDGPYPYRGLAPDDRRFGVATLDEVLVSFPEALLNLDIKQTAPTVVPYEATLARLLRAHRRGDDVIVASFHDSALAAFADSAPEIARAAGLQATTAFTQALARGEDPSAAIAGYVALQVPPSFAGVEVVSERFVAAAHAAGIAVHVWTVDEPSEMERLIALGVDGIMSDLPSVLVTTLAAHGVAWGGAT